ncbi:group I intron-associated PD-(D/E)XK endonuclease [Salarchaeum sp. III]|uniref:group I intron-associated PD-(D/E)XK endonuclease n=1 Tax=Salarchaeum sp. III TaxID=3107927 RepID=UPI002ED97A76
METHQKGDFTEAVVIAELKRREIPVSIPFGDNERYDAVVETPESEFLRVQIKTGWLADGVVQFHGKSQHTNSRGNTYKEYDGDVDYFAVYCHDLEELYWIGENEFETSLALRVEEPMVTQPSINWASTYEFDERWPPESNGEETGGVVERTVAELRGRGVRVFEAGADEAYDVLLAYPDGGFARTSVRPGSVTEGRVRFDTGRTRAPGADEVDLVIVACEALEDVLVVEREAYEKSMSFRVEEPGQRHPGTNLVAEYAFGARWPVG